MILDANDLDPVSTYKILIATVVPRPIAWVSTLSTDGVANLAPFSFFTVVGRAPPTLSITMQKRSDGVTLKDSFVNIRETGEFVTNLVTLPLAPAMHRSVREFEPHEDEFEIIGVNKAPSEVVRPPRVAQAPVAMECKLDRILHVTEGGAAVVWGRVVRFHIRDDLYLPGGRVDTATVPPVGRLAAEYTLANNAFTTPLDPEVLEFWTERRMERLDNRASDFSAVAQSSWSASGSVMGD